MSCSRGIHQPVHKIIGAGIAKIIKDAWDGLLQLYHGFIRILLYLFFVLLIFIRHRWPDIPGILCNHWVKGGSYKKNTAADITAESFL